MCFTFSNSSRTFSPPVQIVSMKPHVRLGFFVSTEVAVVDPFPWRSFTRTNLSNLVLMQLNFTILLLVSAYIHKISPLISKKSRINTMQP